MIGPCPDFPALLAAAGIDRSVAPSLLGGKVAGPPPPGALIALIEREARALAAKNDEDDRFLAGGVYGGGNGPVAGLSQWIPDEEDTP